MTAEPTSGGYGDDNLLFASAPVSGYDLALESSCPAEYANVPTSELFAAIDAQREARAADTDEVLGAGFRTRTPVVPSPSGSGFESGGILDVCPPDGSLAGLTDAATRDGGLAELDDDELIGVLRAWHRLESWCSSGSLAAIAELARRRPADGDRGGGTGHRARMHTRAPPCCRRFARRHRDDQPAGRRPLRPSAPRTGVPSQPQASAPDRGPPYDLLRTGVRAAGRSVRPRPHGAVRPRRPDLRMQLGSVVPPPPPMQTIRGLAAGTGRSRPIAVDHSEWPDPFDLTHPLAYAVGPEVTRRPWPQRPTASEFPTARAGVTTRTRVH